MRLHLIRHPRPLIEAGLCYGRLDVAGEAPEVVAAALLASLPEGLPVWSSPLRRCLDLARCLHAEPRIDARLAEMDFGRWEGQAWDVIPRLELDAWAANVAGYAPPGGESPNAVLARVQAFIADVNVDEAVVVTHAGVIRLLLAAQQGLPPARWCELNFAYGSHTVCDIRR